MRMRALVTVIAAVAVATSSFAIAITVPSMEPPRGLAPPSNEERLALYDDYLDQQWEGLVSSPNSVAERPEIGRIEVLPPSERMHVLRQCLEDAGFTIREEYGEVHSWQSPGGEQARVDGLICESRFPDEGMIEQLMTSEQRSAFYDYNTQFLRSCLAAAGVTVTSTPPSRADFVEQSLSWPSWTPYYEVWDRGYDDEEFAALQSQCPIEPPWRRSVNLFLAGGH